VGVTGPLLLYDEVSVEETTQMTVRTMSRTIMMKNVYDDNDNA
jgi:hypothetical protein